MDDADIDNAVEGSLWGAFGTSGQRCTASSRLVVHKKVYKKFCEKLVEKAQKLKVGNGLDPKIEVGPVINQTAMDKILNYIEIGVTEDKATLACGGNRLTKGEYKNGYFIEPTVFTNVKRHHRIAQEEIFGPVTVVIQFETLDEAAAQKERATDTAKPERRFWIFLPNGNRFILTIRANCKKRRLMKLRFDEIS